jgi:hypothetical protein
MFRFSRKTSSGSHSQYLAKITHSVQCGYMEVVQRFSVLCLHSTTCEACVLCCAVHDICLYKFQLCSKDTLQVSSIVNLAFTPRSCHIIRSVLALAGRLISASIPEYFERRHKN